MEGKKQFIDFAQLQHTGIKRHRTTNYTLKYSVVTVFNSMFDSLASHVLRESENIENEGRFDRTDPFAE